MKTALSSWPHRGSIQGFGVTVGKGDEVVEAMEFALEDLGKLLVDKCMSCHHTKDNLWGSTKAPSRQK